MLTRWPQAPARLLARLLSALLRRPLPEPGLIEEARARPNPRYPAYRIDRRYLIGNFNIVERIVEFAPEGGMPLTERHQLSVHLDKKRSVRLMFNPSRIEIRGFSDEQLRVALRQLDLPTR